MTILSLLTNIIILYNTNTITKRIDIETIQNYTNINDLYRSLY